MSHGGPGHGPPQGHHQPPGHVEPPHLQGHSSGPYGGGGSVESHKSSGASTVEIKGTVYYIYSEADDKFNLAYHGDKVVVAKSNPSDPEQQWIKDESWANKAKDSAGMPAFSLINKATGKALAHPKAAEEPVYLTTYHQKTLNEQYLWTMGKDEGHGYHAVRPVNNINLNLDIDHGSKKYGGITEGKHVIVFTWKDENNQKWTMKKADEKSGHTSHHFHF